MITMIKSHFNASVRQMLKRCDGIRVRDVLIRRQQQLLSWRKRHNNAQLTT